MARKEPRRESKAELWTGLLCGAVAGNSVKSQKSKVKIKKKVDERLDQLEFEWRVMNGDSGKERLGKPFNVVRRAYFFAKDIILFVRNQSVNAVFAPIYSQLIGSATSIGANLVEGRASRSPKDWKIFLTIALKSANETKYWLCLLRDGLDAPKEEVERLIAEAVEISKILGRILVSSKQ